MSQKHKKVCRVLNYIYHSLIVTSTITGCVFLSAFPSLVGIPIDITISAVGLKIYVITAGTKNYQSMIKKKRKKKHNKSKLNSIQVLISKVLIDSNLVLKEYYDMKEEIKYSNNK